MTTATAGPAVPAQQKQQQQPQGRTKAKAGGPNQSKKRRRGRSQPLPYHDLCVELRRDGATVDQASGGRGLYVHCSISPNSLTRPMSVCRSVS